MQSSSRVSKRGSGKRMCRWCSVRPATYYIRSRKTFASDDEHDLCRQCFEKAKLEGEERARKCGILTRRRR